MDSPRKRIVQVARPSIVFPFSLCGAFLILYIYHNSQLTTNSQRTGTWMMNHQPTRKKPHLGVEDRLSNLPEPLISHILSLMDTKDAVQTSVLSKAWRYHWTNIHTLDFDYGKFCNPVRFRKFVLDVLSRRKGFHLHKLKLYCSGTTHVSMARKVFNYAKLHGLEHLETDMVGKFPTSLFDCRNLNTLKLDRGNSRDFPSKPFNLVTLTSLEIHGFRLPAKWNLFSGFLNLVNLTLIDCRVSMVLNFTISAPCLVNLKISGFHYLGKKMYRDLKLVISAPKLQFLELRLEHPLVYPLVLSVENCPVLDQVNIDMNIHLNHCGRKDYKKRQTLISDAMRMLEMLCHVNSLALSLDFLQGKFLLYRNTRDAETKFVELYEETGEEGLLYTLPMVCESVLNHVSILLQELYTGKTPIIWPAYYKNWPAYYKNCLLDLLR
ncbi:hypothetical protein Dsin_024521 [Dipteronia sinensis]|uniref:F-box domain-containing protein n=1 Tax=Dipteronia sinensis TaxID=43782 RepID=A0AAD9ZUC5_9ROSI|nr:hypothetical protein Dsin_024521 [Dipteronia sinensis]